MVKGKKKKRQKKSRNLEKDKSVEEMRESKARRCASQGKILCETKGRVFRLLCFTAHKGMWQLMEHILWNARRGETKDSEIAVRECEAMERRVIVRLESVQGTFGQSTKETGRNPKEELKKGKSGRCAKISRMTKLFLEGVLLILNKKVIELRLHWKKNIDGPLELKKIWFSSGDSRTS